MNEDGVPDSLVSVYDTQETDDEDITPAQVVAEMRNAWHSESVAPCLLPSRMELVHCLVDQIEAMDENVLRCPDKTHIRVSLHRLELQRLNYMINSYMRSRLQKIEENPLFVLNQHEERIRANEPPLLSAEEVKFAQRFSAAQTAVFNASVAKHLPPSLARIPVPQEDLMLERVFIYVEDDNVEDVGIEDGPDANSEALHSLPQGSIHFIPLLPILPALERNQLKPPFFNGLPFLIASIFIPISRLLIPLILNFVSHFPTVYGD